MKHPHRLLLINKKTWKCTLPGCNFFVHKGLEYVLLGKTAYCWECGDTFTIDEFVLRDEMPKCHDCQIVLEAVKEATSVDPPAIHTEEEEKMNEARRKFNEDLGLIPKNKK